MSENQQNILSPTKTQYRFTFRYAFAGVLFGLFFPIIATIIDIVSKGLQFNLENIICIHTQNPLLWIIDIAPLILGIFAGLVGIKQDKLTQQNTKLESEIFARKQAFEKLENIKITLNRDLYNRTLALETSAEVSRRISTILDQDQLIHEVVDQLRTAFGYYHTQIYLYDLSKANLVMVGGTGDAGRTMLEAGHSVPKGRGLVGRAGDTNLPIWVPDVILEEGWLPNPLLPETRAEAAIPIAVGNDVVGVLDVQENKVNGLNEADVDMLQSIANQVAVALQNADAYQRTQKQVEREALMTSINQQIQSTTDVKEALQVAVRELGRALGSDTSIRLIATSKRQ